MSLQGQIHNAIKKFLSKRQQGLVMGEIRKLLPAPVEYDRELIAEILEEYARHRLCDMDSEHLETDALGQAGLLRETESVAQGGDDGWALMTKAAMDLKFRHVDNHQGDIYHALQSLIVKFGQPWDGKLAEATRPAESVAQGGEAQ